VVVNNAIVLLTYVQQLRADGLTAYDALVRAGMARLRPVLLTAITTILGLVPMALGVSFDFGRMQWLIGTQSSQWWGPMAVAVIFGLAFATLLTLVMVPTTYLVLEDIRGLRKRRRAARTARIAKQPEPGQEAAQ
jgi:multidrug efflux pump subunit AcrB